MRIANSDGREMEHQEEHSAAMVSAGAYVSMASHEERLLVEDGVTLSIQSGSSVGGYDIGSAGSATEPPKA